MQFFPLSWGSATHYKNLASWIFQIFNRIFKYDVKKSMFQDQL